ncbi:AAA ATPase domain-containing protein [Paenibacillus tianmuensis]|uniref:AAA ATPase domain-containing protein n=1 Tax=Paenibacillus tianmuensis TaxID=624147 RepID=A0A1G4SQY8_9BACL|nr:AAA family ATPase [Paenibacillus tianmuensis]SCW71377.1 AAA ATPase domain-containing protein [Paenibacillus tianmuensis]
MHIEYVEIQNYRKLKSCRIEFTDQTTIFVGANNSGKTSAMDVLRKFLSEKNDFTVNDFTLSNWIEINVIGKKLINSEEMIGSLAEELGKLVPTMDVWLYVEDHEIHYVAHLIPSLDWGGGLLGVRLRLEPKNIENLFKDFIDSSKTAKNTLNAIISTEGNSSISLWPKDLRDYLSRKFQTHFEIKSYILDPEKLSLPENGVARPQILPLGSGPIEGDPFKRLFLIHNINAQRGFTDPTNKANEDDESTSRRAGSLSAQLRKYYNKHLSPTNLPDSADIGALEAIDVAQRTFNEKLRHAFNDALYELESLGYPGFSNPKITISTKIKPADGLNHDSAVQFELTPENNQDNYFPLRLPELYNGLGYQNLISMIFKLMQFRDEWMKVGKLAKNTSSGQEDFFIPPLHIVLIEEPEAHLHMQVQQVFIRQAYKVLCNHKNLKDEQSLKTQLIVSTHSGHIAHEMPFSSIRYFRRKPILSQNEVPTSTVVNLSNVFGKKEPETERFVTRYLQLTHYDLLFADAAILVEGPAERMLLPHFIRSHFEELNQMYISILEIGGSHAHTLRPLIEALGLTSLIITDLDSANSKSHKSVPPSRKKDLVTGNDTLKSWVPCKTNIDDLLDLKPEEKVKRYENIHFSVRAAYQSPIKVLMVPDGPEVEALPYTFEDALVFENLTLFKNADGNGLIKKFKDAINNLSSIDQLGETFFDDLREGKKADFALQLIYRKDLSDLKVPTYIKEGLTWLREQIKKNQWDNSLNLNSVESAAEEVVGV